MDIIFVFFIHYNAQICSMQNYFLMLMTLIVGADIMCDSEVSDEFDLEKSGPSTPKRKRAIRSELARDEKKSRKQLFSKKWMEEEMFKSWLQTTEDPGKAKCKACQLILGAKRSDLLNHGKSQRHLKNIKTLQGTRPITEIFQSAKQDQNQIIADIRFSLLVASHNFSFSSIDHLTETCKLSFSDSKIAKKCN